jgi:O-antigen/teichoic acid export membrane protein
LRNNLFVKKYSRISVYFFSYFFNAAVSFGVVSLLTHHLSTGDYGIVNLYSSCTLLLTPLLTGGILNTVNVEFFKKEPRQYGIFLTDSLMIPVMGTIFFTVLAFLFDGSIASLLGVNKLFVWLLPGSAFFLLLFEVVTSIYRNKNAVGLYAAFSLGKVLLESGFSILLVLVFHQTWNGRIGGSLMGYIVLMIPVLIILYRMGYLKKISGWGNVKTILFISAPFIPERFASFVLSSSDRYFINHYVNISELGLYGIGSQIAIIVNLSLLSMNSFFFPYIMNAIKRWEDNGTGKVSKAIGSYFAVSLVAIILVLLVTPFVFKWFIGNDFQDGQKYAMLLTLAYIPWALYQSLMPVLLYFRQNKFIMMTSLIGMGVSLLSNFLLVKSFGAMGAAITMFIVNSILMLIVFFRVKNKYSFVLKIKQANV